MQRKVGHAFTITGFTNSYWCRKRKKKKSTLSCLPASLAAPESLDAADRLSPDIALHIVSSTLTCGSSVITWPTHWTTCPACSPQQLPGRQPCCSPDILRFHYGPHLCVLIKMAPIFNHAQLELISLYFTVEGWEW